MGQRNLFFRHFQTKLLKKNYIWNQHPQTCKKVSRAKQNVWILELWMPYLCNLGCNFEKFRVKIKTLKFETKNVLLSIFTLKIWKNDCHIWNQHPRIYRNAKKLCETKKKTNFGPKLPYFGILGCKFDKVLSYLKSASSNLHKCKVSWKIKNP